VRRTSYSAPAYNSRGIVRIFFGEEKTNNVLFFNDLTLQIAELPKLRSRRDCVSTHLAFRASD
jgi:hypothetical protein